jgi:Ca-activated chloride channel family protein
MTPAEVIGQESEERDFYQVLGLPADASPEQIRMAYRDLARQYHPDAGQVAGTSTLFRHIQEAYETLRDPQRRQQYDKALTLQGRRQPALLELDVTLGPTQLACLDETQLLYALIKISPLSAQPAARTPLNVCLVLDHSTSMKGDRLIGVKEATLSLVDQLEQDDMFSIIGFSDRAEVLLPAQHKPDRRTLRGLLQKLQASGGTEIYQGLAAGLSEIRRVSSARQINHVLLLTDGHTYGDAEACLAAAQSAARQNIGISGIGVGNDWNEDFLDLLASAGGGTVLYIEHSDNIGAAFERRLRDLKDAWIPDLSLRLRYDPRAEHKDVFSISPELKRLRREEGEIAIGPLQRTEDRVVLLEMLVSPQSEGTHRLLQMEARGSAPAYGAVATRQHSLWIEFMPAGHTRPLMPPSIIEASRRVTLLRMQERAQQDAKQGLIGPALQRMNQLAKALLREGEGDLAHTIQQEINQLNATGAFSDGGTKRMRYGTRALMLPSGRD